jgi:cytochrome c oxidase subunit II
LIFFTGDAMPFLSQASSAAGKVDSVFLFVLALCAAFLILITTALIYFAIKYNRKRHPKAVDIEGNAWLETAWTLIPTALFLVIFVYGWTNFSYMRETPRDAMVIDVTARQWAWSFQYPNGKRTSELLLAENRPVKLELHSDDVIHGFFIPAFRIKQDVVPGKTNYTWFMPSQLGSFDIECTVICGVSHAMMLSRVIVVSEEDFKRWYFGNEEAPFPKYQRISDPISATPVNPALSILNQKYCPTCHSIDGSPVVGPSFKGLYGKRRTVKDLKGKEYDVTVDELYLAKAIQDPGAETVKGYPPAMPKNVLTDTELKLVIEYIESLK